MCGDALRATVRANADGFAQVLSKHPAQAVVMPRVGTLIAANSRAEGLEPGWRLCSRAGRGRRLAMLPG